jgi:hypothetical protein
LGVPFECPLGKEINNLICGFQKFEEIASCPSSEVDFFNFIELD